MPLEFNIENDILYQRGRAKGREEELERLAQEERLKVATKLKKLGAPLTMIIEVTSLSLVEVTKL